MAPIAEFIGAGSEHKTRAPKSNFNNRAKIWQMLKAPPLKSSGLYILVFQDRPDRGAYNMFEKYVQKGS